MQTKSPIKLLLYKKFDMTQNMEPEDQDNVQAGQNQTDPSSEQNEQSATENHRPLTTQGTQEEIEENLGGTTNLSLDQLKKEGDAGH